MRVLLVDNHDSFTFNLVQLLRESKVEHTLHMVDCDFEPETYNGKSDAVILSPGPGLPFESGNLMKWISRYASKVPMLGVCLGHQALGQYFGGSLTQLGQSMHGERKPIKVETQSKLFSGLPSSIYCGRYHSWVLEERNFPNDLQITARDENDQIMAFEHTLLPIFGVQFHPESYMTEYGIQMIRNFLLVADHGL